MKFTESYSYPANLDTVLKMYRDPAFSKARMAPGKFNDEKVEATGDDSNFTVTASAAVNAAMIPDKVRRFVPGTPHFTIEDQWKRTNDVEATGQTVLKVQGVPVSLTLTSTLKQSGSDTLRTIEGELKVSIPLLGGKLEKQAVRYIPQVIKAEQDAAQQWLKDNN